MARTAKAQVNTQIQKSQSPIMAVITTASVPEVVRTPESHAIARKAIDTYVKAENRAQGALSSAVEALQSVIASLHTADGEVKATDVAQALYGHGCTKNKRDGDPVVYARSVPIYNAVNKFYQKGVYAPKVEKAPAMAEKADTPVVGVLDATPAVAANKPLTAEKEFLESLTDMELEFFLGALAKEATLRGIDPVKLVRAALK